MKVVITGGTGLIGRALVAELSRRGHEPVVLSRTGSDVDGATAVRWDAASPIPSEAVAGAGAIVNLAGASLAEGRWTRHRKEEILESRLVATRRAAEAAASGAGVLVNASAVGYYGNSVAEVDETSPPGEGFLADVVRAWEAEAQTAGAHGVRVAMVRTGVVLARSGGALPRLALPVRLLAGGPIGGGRQWYPWVHLRDIAALFATAVEDARYQGPVIGAAPHPVTQGELVRTLGRVLHRPAILPTPGLAIRLLLGEQAVVVLEGQNARPRVAEQLGFEWAFPELEPALRDLYGS